jgi:hypothetical protein
MALPANHGSKAEVVRRRDCSTKLRALDWPAEAGDSSKIPSEQAELIAAYREEPDNARQNCNYRVRW